MDSCWKRWNGIAEKYTPVHTGEKGFMQIQRGIPQLLLRIKLGHNFFEHVIWRFDCWPGMGWTQLATLLAFNKSLCPWAQDYQKINLESEGVNCKPALLPEQVSGYYFRTQAQPPCCKKGFLDNASYDHLIRKKYHKKQPGMGVVSNCGFRQPTPIIGRFSAQPKPRTSYPTWLGPSPIPFQTFGLKEEMRWSEILLPDG